MSELSIYNMEKEKVGTVTLPDSFKGKINGAVIHQVVVSQLLNRRHGTAKVKNRHEVSGSTRKIYRQKGTGQARHGDIKAPLFVGGGRAFGPKPRNYETRLPQKIRQSGLRAVILERLKDNKFWILEDLNFKTPKTKQAVDLFEKFQMTGALVVVEGAKPAVEKSIRNLNRFKVLRIEALNVIDILKHEHLMMTRGAYEKLIERSQS